MTIVYRLQDHTGRGPYTSDASHVHGCEVADAVRRMIFAHGGDDDRTPGALFDFVYTNNPLDKARVYGFRSIDALLRWFRGYYDILAMSGFEVVSYDVPAESVEHGVSGKQLRFDPARARVLSKSSLEKYME